jgi:peptidoglycan/LPS O-acetylase OafA/YrhL
LRIDALFCGVTLSYYERFRRDSFPKRSHGYFLAWGLAALGLVLVFGETASTLTVAFLGAACLLLWAVPRHPSRSLWVRGLAWIGKYSYAIYLWHVLCLSVVLIVFHWHTTSFTCGVYLLASIAVGVAMAKLVEFPALRLREYVTRDQNTEARSPARMVPLKDVTA